ncbi:MAG: STAS/SEC14 domain-containing protein [Myxococcales bacterium]|nr:STAS/SEC14 domain-containing protein [Myxococcales bacterium]
MPNMVTAWVGDLSVVVHGPSTPSSAEWSDYIRLCKELSRRWEAGEKVAQLVVTAGGGPNLEQRRDARAAAGESLVPVAVVSDSAFARFVVNASVRMRMNVTCRAFAPGELDDALRYLAVEGTEEVSRCIARLQEALTQKKTRASSRRTARGR